MEKYKKTLGNFGEDEAYKYLVKSNYKIIKRNYRCKFGEIDIIALDGNCLVFVEVKTRTSDKYGNPAMAVNFIKQQHLKKTALFYINYYKKKSFLARFDIVEVFVINTDNKFETKKINLIKNAFMI